MKLLTTKNTKIIKSLGRGYITYGLHLLPGRTCSRATPACLRVCLNTSGHGIYRSTQEARARKTAFFWNDLNGFLSQLKIEIEKCIKHAKHKGLIPTFRLNLTSDIPWECYGIPQAYPDIQFYDYSKLHERHPPSNYHLTFSRSESLLNHDRARQCLNRGGNVAVVFKKELPEKFWGYPVISGDEDDLRFLDPSPSIIGLSAKGRARADTTTGFVITA